MAFIDRVIADVNFQKLNKESELDGKIDSTKRL
jgi:hypothetical protein